ncbi:MAG: hypothetical protein GY850_33335 [bacterium]|nr:hypothetical protein [bacterium]
MRYLPVGKLIVRLHENDSLFETLARIAAAKISGNKLWVSIPKGLNNSVTRFLQGKKGLLIENIGWAMLAQNQEIRLLFYLDIPTGFGHTRVHITVPFRS